MSSLNDTTLEANETWGNFLSNVVRQLWLMLNVNVEFIFCDFD